MDSQGLDGNSSTGAWIVRSGDRLIGPFNGKSPAMRHRRELIDAGYPAEAEQLWSPADVRKAIQVRDGTYFVNALPTNV